MLQPVNKYPSNKIAFLLDHIAVKDMALQWVDNRVGRGDLGASM
jgi:hypothetical protein